MRRICFCILCCIACISTFAQKKELNVYGKNYPAVSFIFTTYISYGDERLFPDKDIEVSIAKNGINGYIELSIDLSADKNLCDYFHKCGISGDIMITLANGDTITCKDTGISDFLDGTARAVYTLSSEQMEQLKKTNIELIYFYLQSFTKKGDYLAANFHHAYSSTPDEFTRKKEKVSITKVHKLVRRL